MSNPSDGRRLACLANRDPARSPASVEREVGELRTAGWHVATLSVPSGSAAELLRRLAGFGRGRPLVLLRGLARALRTGAPQARTRLRQLAHLAEAVVLLERLDDEDVRHVHVHGTGRAADVARAAVALGNGRDGGGWTWSLAAEGAADLDDPVGDDLTAKVASATFVACRSNHTLCELARLCAPEHSGRLHLVRTSAGLDAFRSAPSGSRARRGPGLPLRVLFVGRLVPEAAPLLLVDAAARLRDTGIDVVVDIAGRGPLARDIAGAVVHRRVGDRVRLTGPLGQDEVASAYRTADVLCLPGRDDGGFVELVDAMAAGLPVVAPRAAGVVELVGDGVSGLLTRPGSGQELAEALARLVGDPDLRERLGAEARRTAVDEFDPARNVARLAALLPIAAGTDVGLPGPRSAVRPLLPGAPVATG